MSFENDMPTTYPPKQAASNKEAHLIVFRTRLPNWCADIIIYEGNPPFTSYMSSVFVHYIQALEGANWKNAAN